LRRVSNPRGGPREHEAQAQDVPGEPGTFGSPLTTIGKRGVNVLPAKDWLSKLETDERVVPFAVLDADGR
jgi:hypothetical protein